MIIKNKTNQIQEISVMNRDNLSLNYSIYIKAKSEVEVDNGLIITNLPQLIQAGVLAVDTDVTGTLPELPVEETQVEDKVGEVVEVEYEFPEVEESPAVVEETPAEPVQSDDVVICTECGKEFASQRSLTMHMNKAHKE